jgi:hypothetical protein
MQLKEIMAPGVEVIAPEASLQEAADGQNGCPCDHRLSPLSSSCVTVEGDHTPYASPMKTCDRTYQRRAKHAGQGGVGVEGGGVWFKSAGHAQRFLSAYGPIAQHFRPRRHLLSASASRQAMKQRFISWGEITGTEQVA